MARYISGAAFICGAILAAWGCGGHATVGHGAWSGTFEETADGDPLGFDGAIFDADIRVASSGGKFLIVGNQARIVVPGQGISQTTAVSGSIEEFHMTLVCTFAPDKTGRGPGEETTVTITGPIVVGTMTGTYEIRVGPAVVSSGNITLQRFGNQPNNVAGSWSGTYTEQLDGGLSGTWSLTVSQDVNGLTVSGLIDEVAVDGAGSIIGNSIALETANGQLVFWYGTVAANQMSGEWWADGWGSGVFDFTGTR